MKKVLSIFVTLSATLTINAAQAEDFSVWPRRMVIAFSGYTDTETLTDFPALVKLSAAVTQEMKENAADLWFTDFNGMPLAYEVESWDTDGVSAVWVKVPEFAPGESIFAYWGNPLAPAEPNSVDVWSEYTGVWHFNQDSGDLLDSTPNQLHAMRNNVTPAPGVVTIAQFYDGNGHVSVPHNAVMDLGSHFTVSGWYKYPDENPTPAWIRYFGKKARFDAGDGWEMEKQNASPIRLGPRGNGRGNSYISMPNGLSLNTQPREWLHITVQYLGSASGAVYVNGVLADTTDLGGTTAANSTAPFAIGANASGGERWQGYIDEVRLEPGNRSVAWIKACHDTMVNPLFAVCGAPEDNNTPLLLLKAGNIMPVSADVTLVDCSGAGPDIRLYWGENDGNDDEHAWDAFVKITPVNNGAYMYTTQLTKLTPETSYYLRYAIDDGLGNLTWTPEASSFKTPPWTAPVLDSVAFKFYPDTENPGGTITEVTINVLQTGFNPSLIFAWSEGDEGDDFDEWNNVYAFSTPQKGANIFQITGLQPDDKRAWRVRLTASENPPVELSGEFTFAYIYTWAGLDSGTQYWRIADNWDIGMVPNGPGAVVVFPVNCKANVDIAGVGKTLTLGTLTVHGTTRDTGNESRRLFSSDGTPIVWDNKGASIHINWFSQKYWGNLYIQAPQIFTGKTHLTTLGAGSSSALGLMDGPLDGIGPITSDGRRVILGASNGKNNVVSVPIVVENPQGEWNTLWVNGPGVVRMEGTTNTFACGHASGRLIANQGRLVLASKTVVNTRGTSSPRLFEGSNNSLFITEGSIFDAVPNNHMRFGGSTNTVHVTGSGSTFQYYIGEMDGSYNNLVASDGGCAFIRGNKDSFRISGTGQTIRVSSVLSKQPGVINAQGGDLNFTSPNGAIILQSGGVITNVANLGIGSGSFADSRVKLEGGQAFCNVLDVFSDNALEVVLQPNGTIQPIIADKYAWFLPGSKIIVTNRDKSGNTTGRYPLITAPNIYFETELDDPEFLKTPKRYAGTLVVVNNAANNTQTLFLDCIKRDDLPDDFVDEEDEVKEDVKVNNFVDDGRVYEW